MRNGLDVSSVMKNKKMGLSLMGGGVPCEPGVRVNLEKNIIPII